MRGDQFFKEMAVRPPFTKLHPRVGAFFKEYLAKEKVVRFGDGYVVNTNFPPYPSPAFERFAEGFADAGSTVHRRLHNVTLAVTNRCSYKCWHCYNADRSPRDLSLPRLERLAEELADLGAVCVTLTGGEPLIREDLPAITAAFGKRFCLTLGTTGAGLTVEKAARLKADGVFAVGISLDSQDEAEHDRLRGVPGAFKTALSALRLCREAGLYSYVVAVASKALLEKTAFFSFLRFCGDAGAYETHLLEPCPVGRLKGRKDAVLSPEDSSRILDYQAEVAGDESLPILSAYAYVESPEAFGCGAGLTHLYIDGSGEVSPCNFVPLSFGSLADQPLAAILERMGKRFKDPRPTCVGKILGPLLPDEGLPAPGAAGAGLPLSPEASEALCDKYLPKKHAIPRFFKIRSEAVAEAGGRELKEAYAAIHSDYDEYWVSSAGRPVEDLVAKLGLKGGEKVFEAGCGTGFGTALLAPRLTKGGSLLAVDLSPEMLGLARKRLASQPGAVVTFVEGDALKLLCESGPFDLIATTWVLGYIPLSPFFKAAAKALKPEGRLAFIVHRENSPARELGIFYALGAEDPDIMEMKVSFDFPTRERAAAELAKAGFRDLDLWEGTAVFRYPTPQAVLDHLLKSGAGTAFYNAVRPDRRKAATQEFLKRLEADNAGKPAYEVRHDFVACVAAKG
ncbi:MAG: radical SAM protein [Elusimicrobiota bacterium]|jgi:MoaA/NifB/PqqE/SkfB family radical SAM enzyme/ubiquinone/menaquinone biosynthesis C-methylase UbiE